MTHDACVIPEHQRQQEVQISFEFFPPKTQDMDTKLWQSIQRLAPLNPSFVSVTYGAGGSTRARTHATVARILQETNLKPAAHLTCVGASAEELMNIVKEYEFLGVQHIVALRGDPVEGLNETFQMHPSGYRYASELVAAIAARGICEISVAAYPEKHPESSSFAQEIDVLKIKIEKGATRAITQFFFDNDHYWRYLERIERAGITIPIVPGIIPIHQFENIAKFAIKAGASIPSWLEQRFAGLAQPEAREEMGVEVATEQVRALLNQGVRHVHFYTMNRAEMVYSLCQNLGLKICSKQEAA